MQTLGREAGGIPLAVVRLFPTRPSSPVHSRCLNVISHGMDRIGGGASGVQHITGGVIKAASEASTTVVFPAVQNSLCHIRCPVPHNGASAEKESTSVTLIGKF